MPRRPKPVEFTAMTRLDHNSCDMPQFGLKGLVSTTQTFEGRVIIVEDRVHSFYSYQTVHPTTGRCKKAQILSMEDWFSVRLRFLPSSSAAWRGNQCKGTCLSSCAQLSSERRQSTHIPALPGILGTTEKLCQRWASPAVERRTYDIC